MKKNFVRLLLLIFGMALGLLVFGQSMIEKAQNVVIEHEPYAISQEAQTLHDSLIIGDWHADSLLWGRDLSKQEDYGQLDIPRMQQGNVGLQMFTTVTKSPDGLNYDENAADSRDNITLLAMVQRWPTDTWKSLTARALHQAQRLHQLASNHPQDLFLIQSQADLQTWQTRRQANPKLIGGLLGTEGSHALDGNLSNVNTLYDAGFRMMSLQHFFDNKLGGSLHGQKQGGLTRFGRDVVKKIESLNIILDVSHSSEAVVKDVLEIASRPIIISHTGLKGHCDTARNIQDELMQTIAKKGGLIAIGYWDGAVCSPHPKDIVKAIQYGISLVGEDHLSLGSDFDGSVTTRLDTSELAVLTQEMMDAGLSEQQIRKVMGENMLRFLQTYLPKE